ncbi:unnamed protein product [Symbiodinium sp. CCMP2456]|nr:unnamed protein product [Symbiodinium sp. CCMP2456]
MEKLKSSEEVCEIAKQHVRKLQDDLEASELESAQAAMKLCFQYGFCAGQMLIRARSVICDS